jgi:uncharacterized spore protein YtfJ
MSGDDALKASLDELLKSLKLLGEIVDLEDRIIIPVAEITIAFAGGQGKSIGEKKALSAGGGAGYVAGLHPFAALDLCKTSSGPDGVKLLLVSSQKSSISSIAHAVMEEVMLHKEAGAK